MLAGRDDTRVDGAAFNAVEMRALLLCGRGVVAKTRRACLAQVREAVRKDMTNEYRLDWNALIERQA